MVTSLGLIGVWNKDIDDFTPCNGVSFHQVVLLLCPLGLSVLQVWPCLICILDQLGRRFEVELL